MYSKSYSVFCLTFHFDGSEKLDFSLVPLLNETEATLNVRS